ncbi:LysR family transcriptional regulator [Nocardia sp. NPDC050193]
MRWSSGRVGQFLAVARVASSTAAAQEVHIVQSALSASILKLETELGVPLLERTTPPTTHRSRADLPTARPAPLRQYRGTARISEAVC